MTWKNERDKDEAWNANQARRDALLAALDSDSPGYAAAYREIVTRCADEWKQTLGRLQPKWYEVGKLFAR